MTLKVALCYLIYVARFWKFVRETLFYKITIHQRNIISFSEGTKTYYLLLTDNNFIITKTNQFLGKIYNYWIKEKIWNKNLEHVTYAQFNNSLSTLDNF